MFFSSKSLSEPMQITKVAINCVVCNSDDLVNWGLQKWYAENKKEILCKISIPTHLKILSYSEATQQTCTNRWKMTCARTMDGQHHRQPETARDGLAQYVKSQHTTISITECITSKIMSQSLTSENYTANQIAISILVWNFTILFPNGSGYKMNNYGSTKFSTQRWLTPKLQLFSNSTRTYKLHSVEYP